jgi:glycosyltransferase involved in cell wall biosynthesis
MKIAVIGAKGLPAKQGGIEHHCEEIYPRLVAQGCSVDLFARSSYTGDISLHKYDVKGVQVVSLPCLNLKGMDALLSSALGAVASSGTRYDIIHFHAIGPALFSWLPRIATTAKVVVTCHGLDWQRAKWSKASSYVLRLGERAAVRFADGLIVVSEELRSYFKQTYGKETIYIPNAPSNLGESDANFSYGTSLGLTPGRYILFLGRLVPEKCPDVLIKAFQALQASGWKLVLVGGTSDTGEYRQQLLNLAQKSTDVVFAGELQGARLAEVIRGAGLFVLPSELEGLPLAMLEAMQEGVPVLASDIPVHKQLIAHKRGMLFTVNDQDSCARSLDWALHHPQELAVMARNAQEYVETYFNWDDITTNTLRFYQELVCPLVPAVPVIPKGRLSKTAEAEC